MEPEIRYVRSADGTNIATWTLGAGPPLVVTPGFGFGTMQLTWEFPGFRASFEALGQRHRVISYDHRGFGLSDHDVADMSLAALVADLDAVARTTGTAPIDLMGRGSGGPAAIAWAAQSGRVQRLVLYSTTARGADFRLGPKQRLLAPLVGGDFDLYCQTLALVNFGWTDTGRRVAELMSKYVKAEALASVWGARREWDASAHLPEIVSPTLVINQRAVEGYQSGGVVDLDVARALAAALRDARLVIQTGNPFSTAADGVALAQVILDFLDADRAPGTPAPLPSGTAIILFADVVDSTSLTESMGDAAFRAKARELDEAMRAIIGTCGGTPIAGKLLGDGVLATFASAAQAIDAALGCRGASETVGLQLHFGLHAGDVIREDNNVYGGAVNLAARIASASAPGEILISDTVRSLARTSATVTFDNRGDHSLKGVADPQHLFAVRSRA